MKIHLFPLAIAGFCLLALAAAATTTTRKTTTKPKTTTRTTTKRLITTTTTRTTTTTTPTTTTTTPTTTTTTPTTTTKRTRGPTTPHTLVNDPNMEAALDYIIIIIYNYMNVPDLPKVYSNTALSDMVACLTPEQRDEMSQVMQTCQNQTQIDPNECFFLSLLMDSSGTRVELQNMIYIIEYTNLTSTQKTGAIARMEQCYQEDTNMTRELFSVFLALEPVEVFGVVGPIVQNMFNGHYVNYIADETKLKEMTEHLHVWKAMICVFQGLFTNGCPNIVKPPATTKSSRRG